MKFKKHILLIVGLVFTITVYGQIDSLENKRCYSWILNPYDLSMEREEIDTSLYAFQNYNSLLSNTITVNYIGNLGGAAQSQIYYDRQKYNTGFIFSEPYGIYFHSYKTHRYYNTKRQFTLLKYSNTGPRDESEQVLEVIHTQNVNKNFNFGLNYDLISSEGRYQNQQIRQNLVSLFSSYHKKAYHLHTNFGLNRVKAQENGGIDSLKYLGADEFENRKNIPVKLTDATNQVLNTNFYLAHEYNFGKTIKKINERNISNKDEGNKIIINKSEIDSINENGLNEKLREEIQDSLKLSEKPDTINIFKISGFSISHQLFYNSDVRKFSDDKTTEEFYNKRDFFIDTLKTNDDIRQKQFGNKVSFNFKFYDKFSSCISAYNEQMDYKYNILPDTTYRNLPIGDTIVYNDKNVSFSNTNVSFYLKAKILNRILFKGYAEYYISGYKNENSFIDMKFSYFLYGKTEVGLEGKYSNKKADYFYTNYESNNFKWENSNLRKQEEWNVGFFVRNKEYKLDAQVRYGQFTNYIYLDTTAYVNQYRGQINLITGDIFKRIKIGPVHSVTHFVYQQCTNDSILSIPRFNLYQSLYFERLSTFESTGGKLLWQIGLDYRYSSSYNADGYMPTSGLFYRQYDHKLDDYQCLDLFINFSLRRARFYIKYNYLNSLISKKYYFTGAYNPAPMPALKFGLSWTFYD